MLSPRFLSLATAAALMLCSPASRALDPQTFDLCVGKLRKQALDADIPAQVISDTLNRVELDPKVVELDQSQPEFTSSFADYFTRRVSDTRIEKGRHYRQTLAPLLTQLTREYGVPGRYLLAFWGLETNYGSFIGNTPTLNALATLACEGRRGDYFSAELLNALRIIQAGDIDAAQMKGSWAGAMGQVQFMPAVFLRYAVDGDGDGHRNLWQSTPDALASAAHFLQGLGWQREQRWGREVLLPEQFDFSKVGLDQSLSLAEWNALGLRMTNGQRLAETVDWKASLLLPSGHCGPAFLVYPNFRVIMGWNRSESYALAVGRLADRIAGAGPLRHAPVDAPRLSREQVTQLQQTLNQQGFDAGEADGLLGPGTRSALARYQQQHGMIADGFPDREVLQALGIL
ncbi:glycosidase [Alcanivorax hongdengensis A-11-3]|uniref:Glycosidase n=1 Tax=Alcanivorax hongdengensis A-11-3 TaxID=1177179 RepID=L0WCK2_9GAMM|nr:lytic murein transglycosylase [Alcanivorax hongdengensis]EKF74729.1 glycosidase [Alcanivorax hongdengensis A-11-3]